MNIQYILDQVGIQSIVLYLIIFVLGAFLIYEYFEMKERTKDDDDSDQW